MNENGWLKSEAALVGETIFKAILRKRLPNIDENFLVKNFSCKHDDRVMTNFS